MFFLFLLSGESLSFEKFDSIWTRPFPRVHLLQPSLDISNLFQVLKCLHTDTENDVLNFKV